jgi:aryl-alcohol dehydrogenase-like predicted oxidoreductase
MRKLGNSDLKVSEIVFGAWAAGGWMWGSTDRQAAVDAIKAAYGEGVTSIDTAPIYGQGTSEEIVGEAIKDLDRTKVQILTKFGLRWDSTEGTHYFASHDNQGKPIDIYKFSGPESIILECENSLRRLGTDYIDLYQIHWPDVTTAIDITFEAVSRLIEQGKVRYAGVCNYDLEQVKQAAPYIVSNQIPYSMVNRGIEKDVLPYCKENNIGVLAYSPLERGLLTGKITSDYRFEAGDHRASHPHFQPDFVHRTQALLDRIRPIAAAHGASLHQTVLAWTLAQPGISAVLVGARNAAQSVSNAKQLRLSAEEITHITSAVHAF